MTTDRWGRRLVAALLVVSVSTGLGAQMAGTAGTVALAGGVVHDMRPWLSMPLGLAAKAAVSATWTQQAELTSTAETGSDGFGLATAYSGNTTVIGAATTGNPNDYGAAYIFGRSGSTWSQQAAFTDPGSVPDAFFGQAVAASGPTVAFGAPGAPGVTTDTGAVYLYGRTGRTWATQATLTASDGAYVDGFGQAVALSGTTLAIGAPGKNGAGAVYVFARSGSTWTQQAEVFYPGHVGYAGFGSAVALSGDTLVVGTLYGHAAYVYVRSGSRWREQAVLRAPPQASGQYFGLAVALSGDTALVSACCARATPPPAVVVYERSGTTWTQQATLSPPGPGTGSGEEFGFSVALSGHTAVVGGGGDNCTCVYVGRGSTWTLQAQLVASDRGPNDIGQAVALQGNTTIIGAGEAAYVFVRAYS